ncbi:MAG: hypothetical protein NTW51_13075 [Cyanobacteria bacterium]|nr:hypothetical protein [Cyanobacteriota bacterium]
MPNSNSPSVVALLFSTIDQAGLSNSQRWLEPHTAHSAGSIASIPTLSVPELNLSLHRPTARSGNVKTAAPFDPQAAGLLQAITRSPGGPRPASTRTSAPLGRSTLSLALRQETPGGTRRAEQQSGDVQRLAAPQATEANPVDFSNDNDLREATVVAGSDLTSTVALMDLGWTFQLHSSPTSSKVIYLDFNGHTTTGYGIRAVITGYGPSSSVAGGIAIANSFNAATDTPCFIYNKSLTGAAEAVSHEVGHSLGLSHDGTSSNAYYYGHGSGEISWAPIMGVGYNKNVTSWDNGTYYGSTNGSASANYGHGPNDMAVISTFNGFGYQLDQIGNDLSSTAALTIAGGVVSQFGRIETSLDSDCYSFQLQSSGNVNLKFDPYCYRAFVDRDGDWGGSNLVYTAPVSDGNSGTPYADNGTNLDLSVGLYSSSGSLLGSFNNAGLATTLVWSNLAAGTYYVKLDGVGTGNPTSSTPSGYNDYGSVGNYLISGTIVNALDSGTPLATTTALAPKDSTLTAAFSTPTKAAAPAAGPRDSITGITAGSVPSLATQSDPLLAPRLTVKMIGQAFMGFGADRIAGLQEGPIAAPALPPLLGSLGEPSRSPFAADLPTAFGAPGLGSERLYTERPAWFLA